MSNRKTIVSIIGTRPEAIKMAPVVRELERHPAKFQSIVVCTEQHRELLGQAMAAFSLRADVHLNLMEAGQGLAEFAARSLSAVSAVLDDLRPDMVLVQGDTTTMVTAALAAFYKQIRVGHVEAGLRSFDRENPFPEEINRRMAEVLVDLHFAPTNTARRNLLATGVPADQVFVTGNTIVDARGGGVRTVVCLAERWWFYAGGPSGCATGCSAPRLSGGACRLDVSCPPRHVSRPGRPFSRRTVLWVQGDRRFVGGPRRARCALDRADDTLGAPGETGARLRTAPGICFHKRTLEWSTSRRWLPPR